MNDDFDDYPVRPLSNDDIEAISERIRRRLGFAETAVLTAVGLLTRFCEREAVELVVRPDATMGRSEAFITTSPSRLFLRESGYQAALQNDARALMTIAHEIFHYFAHPGVPKARVADGNVTPKFISPAESAERQARYGAGAILMPRRQVEGIHSANEVRKRFGVSLQAAKIRIEQCRSKSNGRSELPFVRAHIEQLKSMSGQRSEEARNKKLAQARALWATLQPIEDLDPSIFRLCSHNTYQIAWLEFDKMTQCGWSMRDGKAVAWLARS